MSEETNTPPTVESNESDAAPAAEPTNIEQGEFAEFADALAAPAPTRVETDYDVIRTQANSLTLTISSMVSKREELGDEIKRLRIIAKHLNIQADVFAEAEKTEGAPAE